MGIEKDKMPKLIRFQIGSRYIIRHDDGSHNVYYVKKRTDRTVTFWDGKSFYRRSLHRAATGSEEYVQLYASWKLYASHLVPDNVPNGFSESLLDQEFYVDNGI